MNDELRLKLVDALMKHTTRSYSCIKTQNAIKDMVFNATLDELLEMITDTCEEHIFGK